ncbi:hypothetical protein FNV43_RR12552 [Rhamnella rubrinervis]|uniref:ACB domain-containing protein n=1 Tax=Rhamnella rubrinervis TaxID=2594499 RepID=A0A8K0MIL4_9ROSA|nr:hypothetical protein FNV43_RR12552 [Rhamnella rubrinervis]
MALKEEFEEHVDKAKTLPESKLTDDNKLKLYGLYKQATGGSISDTTVPAMFDNLKEKAKWNAWKAVEWKSQEEARKDYITMVKQLLAAAAASSSR